MSAPIPLKRHEHLFQDVGVPRTANFNPDQVSAALVEMNVFVMAHFD